MPGRVRGGVVSRTGDRVGDALEMRTRRVGVEGFVASLRCLLWRPAYRRALHSVVVPLQAARSLVFFCLGLPLRHCFWAADARICAELTEHYYACTTSRCPTVFNWARRRIAF